MAKKTGKVSRKQRAVKTAKTPVKAKSKPVAAPQRGAAAVATTPPIKQPAKLPNAWQLTRRTAELLWRHKGLFVGITLVYGILNLLLVQGLANSTDVSSLKTTLNHAFTGGLGSLASGLSIFVVLVSSAGNGSSQTAGAYQFSLAIITSLAVIWTLRKLMAGSVPRVKDAYYGGMYPIIPFILILLVIGLQLLPLIVGSAIYSTVVSNGIAVNLFETLLWLLLFLGTAAWSVYMISASMIALYIVTLPDMTPKKALRSARDLVQHRRWTVIRKVLCLPVILLVVAAVIMLPIIILLTPLSQWVFFLLTMFSLAAIHTYMYTLYRELLNE